MLAWIPLGKLQKGTNRATKTKLERRVSMLLLLQQTVSVTVSYQTAMQDLFFLEYFLSPVSKLIHVEIQYEEALRYNQEIQSDAM